MQQLNIYIIVYSLLPSFLNKEIFEISKHLFVDIGDQLNEANHKHKQKITTSSRKKSNVEADSDSNSSLASSGSVLSSVSTRRSSSAGKTIEPVKPKSGRRLYKYLCKKCGFGSDLQIGFSQHCKTTHQEIVYYCEVNNCDYFFFSQNGLRNHAKGVHPTELSCGICSSISLTPKCLAIHVSKHSENSKLDCPSCFKAFTRVHDRDKHFTYTCPKNHDRHMFCKHCKEECTGAEASLAEHLRKEHNLVGIFLCLNCHTLYATERKLDRHHEHCTKKNPMRK